MTPERKIINPSNRSIRFWNQNGQLIRVVCQHHQHIYSLALSSKGILCSGGADGIAHLMDIEGNLLTTLSPPGLTINSVAFSPDGQLLVTGSEIICLWSTEGKLLATFNDDPGYISFVAFSPDGQTIASVIDKFIYLWDLNGNLLHKVDHQVRVEAMTYAANGNLVTGSEDCGVYIWDKQLNQVNHLSPTGMIDIVESSSSGQLVTVGDKFLIWDTQLSSNEYIHTYGLDARAVTFNRDGNLLAVSLDQGLMVVSPRGHLHRAIKWSSMDISLAVFSMDGTRVATGGYYGFVSVWSIDGQLLHTLHHGGPIHKLIFSINGYLASQSDKKVIIWLNDAIVYELPSSQETRVELVGFLDDNTVLVYEHFIGSSNYDKPHHSTIQFWSQAGILLREIASTLQGARPISIDNQKQIMLTFIGRAITVYDFNLEIINKIEVDEHASSDIIVANDGRIASLCYNDRIRIWSLEGKLLHEIPSNKRLFFRLHFSTDGDYLRSYGRNGYTYWDRDGNEVPKPITYWGDPTCYKGMQALIEGETVVIDAELELMDDMMVRFLKGKLPWLPIAENSYVPRELMTTDEITRAKANFIPQVQEYLKSRDSDSH